MGWYNPNWTYRTPIQSQNAKVAEAVTNGYIDLSEFGSAFFWAHVKNGGGDIRITKADGTTEIAREIVSCDTGLETGEIHFDCTGIQTGSDVTWYIYYGNAAASDYAVDATYGAENVWDSDYAMVHHLQESADEYIDSTDNDNDSTVESVASRTADGQIGKCPEIESGSANYISFGDILPLTGDFTIEIIVRIDNHTTYGVPFNKGSEDWVVARQASGNNVITCYVSNTIAGYFFCDSDGVLNVDQFYHVAFKRDGTALSMLIDGAVQADTETFSGTQATSTDPLYLGKFPGGTPRAFDGRTDEVRISDGVARSDNWLLTQYNNQNDAATFWSIGTEEELLQSTLNRISGVLDRTAAGVLVRVAVT